MIHFFRKVISHIFQKIEVFMHPMINFICANRKIKKVRDMIRREPAIELVPEKPLQDFFPDVGNLSKIIPFQTVIPEYDISIIIPMYNAAEYIVPCLESVLQQDLNASYEVLLIDDGSTDDTLERIAPYLARSEFKLIRQENHGQSYARNRAIEQSAGKYLFFLDADDLLLPGALEILFREAKKQKADIVECEKIRFHDVLEPRITPNHYRLHLFNAAEQPLAVLTSTGYSAGILFDRNLWKTLRFPEGYIFEDVITKFILRRKANCIAKLDVALYGYRINHSSSSHQTLNLKHLDSVWVFPQIFALCKSEGVSLDSVFYLLALNHITILNAITVGRMPDDIAMAGFCEMQKQLKQLLPYRPKRIPKTFRILEKAVLQGNLEAWKLAADTVISYRLLSKWREIN